jgi:hypothetical protein
MGSFDGGSTFMEEMHGEAGDVRAIAQPIDYAIVVGPLVPVIGKEFVGVHSVGLDHHGFVEMLGISENARRGHEPAGEGSVEIHDVENVILDLIGIDGDGPLDLFNWPPVNVEGAIQDDIGTENFAQGLGKVPQLAGVLGLKVAELVEGADTGQARLDEAGVGGPLARQRQGTHRFHSGSIERSQ